MSYREDAKVFKSLSDENRLAILELLKDGEKCAQEIIDIMDIAQPTLSHHMKILTDAGIVEYRKEGKWIYYSISENGKRNLTKLILNYMLFCELSEDSLKSLEGVVGE